MNFDLSEEQQMFVTSVERFAAPIDVEARRKLRLSPTGYDRGRWQSLAEMGLIALAAGEDAGGMGGSAVDLALVCEAIGKANAPDPLLEHGILPALLLERGGAGAALDSVLSGETIATLAWTERGQRYSLKAKGMKAEEGADGVLLSGEKTMVMGRAVGPVISARAAMAGGGAAGGPVHRHRRPWRGDRLLPRAQGCEWAGGARLSSRRRQHRGRIAADPYACSRPTGT
ncbi:hypothetical protein CHX26_01260 [Porphyrobacter sp. HT-58-2]|uniref:acyl-CoA dehydrogenase family protein n=1 Tax=Porphyrobacter sp. HT-58-2 TaxID=2023229 RepID=UPI000CDC4065|nr:acyl-CoA dehydrogenase family protein [Porphyrobacter sp. HT-58-2]AUX68329.1 hypothetical protein CHX26_01260 [Porphyrobacter sp. HT-58-2]